MEGFNIETQTSIREYSREKKWYLLIKDHHIGPFTLQELIKQNAADTDLVWHQGMNTWTRIGDLREFDPTPPPIPVEEKKEEIKEIAPEPVVEKAPRTKSYKYALLLVPFLIIGSIYYYLTIPPIKYLPFVRLYPTEYKRLKTQVLDKNFKGEVILSQDGKEIWLASGLKGLYRADLTLDSIDGAVLGPRKIRITSNTKFDQNWARFHIFDLEYGTQIVPGRYTYKLIGRPLGPKHQLNTILKGNENTQVLNLSGEILFSKDPPEIFKEKLKIYKKKLMAYKLGPFKDRMEKWNAFTSVLTKVDVLYQDTIKDIKYGKSIKKFESKYNEFLGSMLRSLILEMRAIYKSNAKNSAEFKKLYLFGRQIGEMVSDMIVKTRRYKKVDPQAKGRLSRYFLKKTKGFKEQAEKEVGLLQEKIKSFEQS